VHHLNPKIPNYNLQRAHEEQPMFRPVPAVSFTDGLRATTLKLWCEDSQQMMTWKQARAVR
jgi:omega-6 fatty acid desaturase (delta-12 desaturase)